MKERYAMILYYYNHQYNLIGQDHYLQVNKNSDNVLVNIHTGERDNNPELKERMSKMADALYHGSRYLLLRNIQVELQ